MPEVSGYEVCMKLRESYPVSDLPVIFLTAKNQVSDLVESFDVGANDYLSKPVAKHELLARVKTHLQLLDINRNLEVKVSERTEQLQQATAAKSDFLAKMSHEIRTPMNAVIGLSRLALKTPLNPQQQDYIEKVAGAGEALLGLINDILDFSKIEAGKLTIERVPFRLDELIPQALTLSALNAHEKGLELVADIAPDVPNGLLGDPLRLQQIVVNLVNNAVKFTERGSVCLQVRCKQQPDGELQLACAVIDTGIGMTPEQQSRMFQSFSQADETITRKHGGTGLGLAISRQLCELMGGQIWLESEYGVGSEFHFTVNVGVDPQVVAQPPVSEQGLKVLLVEDLPLAAQVATDLLQRLGVECHHCSDGGQALALAKSALIQGQPFDLALVDWQMSGLNGAETATRLGRLSVPSLLLASSYQRDELAALYDGVVIEKPLLPNRLTRALHHWNTGENWVDAERPQAGQAPDLSGNRVLLVDDNAINRQVAQGILSETGVTIELGENGLVALAKIQQQEWDLVLMDVQMPQMDGLTAVGEIRNALGLAQLPVIAMTAHAMEEDIQKSLDAGMNGHITKPIDPKALFACLSEYLKPKVDVANTSADLEETTGAQAKQLMLLDGVEGLEHGEALAALGGRAPLYLELVADFCEAHQAKPQQLDALAMAEDWQTLFREVHSLKSNTAYIGAFSLSALCGELEAMLGDEQWDPAKLQAICRMLSELTLHLTLVLERSAGQAEQSPYETGAIRKGAT